MRYELKQERDSSSTAPIDRLANVVAWLTYPLTAVAIGTGRCLDELSLLREVTLRSPIS